MLVEEKISGEIRGRFLHLNVEALPGAPNQLRVVEDVVGGSALEGFDASGLLRFRSSKTLRVCVTESNEGGGRGMVRWPLELGEGGSDGCGGRKVGRFLKQPKTRRGTRVLPNRRIEERVLSPECGV